MLTINNLHKSFDDNHVLIGLDLTIAQGAMTAIIGPNGCGKSTLLNVITGELSPSSGDVRFNGKSLTGLRPRQIAQCGILRKFQIPGIYPSMTIREHLVLAFIVKKQKVTSQLEEVAMQMGLAKYLETPAKVLATGQKQWLELAMLVLLDPTLLLLDEPIAGMTAKEADKTCEILQSLNANGLTIVTIEHNIHFVQNLTDDIVVLMHGKVNKRADFRTISEDVHIREHYLGSLYA